jgi:hypothetical protein
MNALKNQTLEVGGQSWLVREARSHEDAMNAIAMARVTGSVGNTDILDNTACGGSKKVLADVVRVDSLGATP